MRRLAIAALLVVLATACVADDGGSSASDDPNTVSGCDDVFDLRKLREELTTGAGRLITVRAVGVDGEAVLADPSDCLRTTSPGIDIATARTEADDPTVAVLVDSGTDATEAAESADAAIELVDSLAADVDVAVFGLGPVADNYSSAAVVSEPPTEWYVWNGAGAPADDWERNPLLLDGGFSATPTPLGSLPEGISEPVLARTNLVLDDAIDPSGVLLSGSHTGGLVLRLGGTEVLRSNLGAGALGDDTRPVEVSTEPIDFSVTVAPELFTGRDTVASIEWFGASGTATPFFDLTAVDNRSRPGAAAPLTGFSRDRAFAVAQIERREPRGLAAAELAPAATVVAAHLDERRERSTDGPKVLVVVAPHRSAEELPEFGGDPVVVWIGDDAGSKPRGVHRVDVAEPGAGAGVAALVESYRRAGVWAVGLCGPSEPIEPVIEVADTPAKTSPKLAATVGSGSCDPAAAVMGAAPVTSLQIDLTDEQQRVFEQRVSEVDRRPVPASLTLGEGVGVAAEMRIRGQSTLDCERKSYSVSLADRVPVPLFEGWHPSEFTLLSLCLDRGYVRTLTTFRLLEALGLSDLRMSMVDLVIAGESRGAYLLIERADDLTEHAPTAVGVVRRRLDRSIQVSEVEWSRNQRPDLVFDEYESVITFAETYEGDDLVGDLDERMDLDQYLRWLALMSLVENGDYSDEVFFVGDPVARGTDLELRWHIQPWDPDDMFQPCHLDGVLEVPDPAGLTSCAESRIDAAILGDDGVYARYQSQLDLVLDELTPQRFADTVTEVRAELDEVLGSEAHRTMNELAADDTTVVDRGTFDEALDRNEGELIERFRDRHVELMDLGRRRGGPLLGDEVVEQLTLLAPAHTSLGGGLPLVIEARRDDGTIDESVSGLVPVEVRSGAVDVGPIVIRRGRGSTTGDVTAADGGVVTISLGRFGPTASVDVDSSDRSTRSVAGDLTADDLFWGPDETVIVTGDVRVPKGSTLVIEPGTRVELAPAANLDVAGVVESRATHEAPTVFAPLESGEPWGGVLHFAGDGDYVNTWFVGGGGQDVRSFGHSGSQPLVFAVGGAEVTFDRAVFQDGPGKGPSADGASVSLSDSLITRLDTGGEFVDSTVLIDRSWFLDFPNPDQAGDDDNDALYLARSAIPSRGEGRAAEVRSSVFIGGADDGIDHNGADVELDRLWIEGFAHECVAFSAGGVASLVDSVMTRCEQGVEIGYGSPDVSVGHVVVTGNDVGVRYGDEYGFEAAGSAAVEDSIVVDNADDVRNFVVSLDGPAPGAVAFARTLVGAPDPADGDVLTGVVTFNDRLLLGPLSAGVGEAQEGRDLGLLTPRPR